MFAGLYKVRLTDPCLACHLVRPQKRGDEGEYLDISLEYMGAAILLGLMNADAWLDSSDL